MRTAASRCRLRESGERELGEQLSQCFIALVSADTDDKHCRRPLAVDRRGEEAQGPKARGKQCTDLHVNGTAQGASQL